MPDTGIRLTAGVKLSPILQLPAPPRASNYPFGALKSTEFKAWAGERENKRILSGSSESSASRLCQNRLWIQSSADSC